tara:strand:+ start:162 stop:524 length:363 start_codon:yes stop_codon:yes gene_type:complete
MFSKIFNKLKSILGKKSVPQTTKSKKVTKSAKSTKSSKSTKTSKTSKTSKSSKALKGKKQEVKLILDSFTNLPGIGAKSAKAFYEAGFKSTKDIIAAKDEDLLAVPGVGINLVKKLKNQK